jgi:hypothetical protein
MKLLPVGALLVVVTSWHLHRAAALSPAETHFAIGPVEDDVDAQEELVPKYMLAGSFRLHTNRSCAAVGTVAPHMCAAFGSSMMCCTDIHTAHPPKCDCQATNWLVCGSVADDRAVFLSNVRDVLELMGYQATDDPSQAHVIW